MDGAGLVLREQVESTGHDREKGLGGQSSATVLTICEDSAFPAGLGALGLLRADLHQRLFHAHSRTLAGAC